MLILSRHEKHWLRNKLGGMSKPHDRQWTGVLQHIIWCVLPEHGIDKQITIAKTPQQKAFIEKMNKMLLNSHMYANSSKLTSNFLDRSSNGNNISS